MNEQDFVHNIRHALDQSIDSLGEQTRAHLFAARRQAMAATGHGGHADRSVLTLARRHVWLSLLVLVTVGGLVIWQGLKSEAPPSGDDLDILMLTDDIPPQAFFDWKLVRQEHVEAQCLIAN